MNSTELDQIRHAHALIRDLSTDEDGFMECLQEAAETLSDVLEAATDTPAQILRLVTNA